MNVEIYCLIDPRDGKVKYVGRSISAKGRYYQHIHNGNVRGCSRMAIEVHKWIHELRILQLKPILEIIERCPEENGKEREDFWINYYYDKDDTLRNMVIDIFGKRHLALDMLSVEYIKKLDKIRTPLNISRLELLKILIDNELTLRTK